MYLKYEVREVREKALSRSSDVEQVALTAESFQWSSDPISSWVGHRAESHLLTVMAFIRL